MAVAALGLTPAYFEHDLKTFGYIFECLCIRDLIRKHNETEEQVPLREPDLLIVITGTETAFKREDGVIVLPIGCLRD